MKEQLEAIRQEAEAALQTCTDAKQLDAIRVQYLGKKGALTAILKQMGKLSAEERPVMGQLANAVRSDIESAITKQQAAIQKLLWNRSSSRKPWTSHCRASRRKSAVCIR